MIGGISVWCNHDKLVDTGKLIPFPRNPNVHPLQQIEALAKVIKYQGWRAPITVSNRSGYIVRGHGRLMAAKLLGLPQVPVDYQDYENEAAEWADCVADNKISELASMDDAILRELMRDIKAADFDMDLTGFDFDELGQMFDGEDGQGKGDNEDTDNQKQTLFDRFIVPPFSILDARQGYWQERKRAWIAIGIRSELGRGGGNTL